jgi:AcrR family transcriptional regulator
MTRIVKDPVERRREIMNKASELFFSRGYDNTSINTIVEELNIAKGTFYHYFSSKEEILCAILEESLEEYSEGIKEELSCLSGAESRMKFILKRLLMPSDAPTLLTNHIEDDENAKTHQMLEKMFYEKFHPILVNIVEEGVEEGIFQICYPEEITEILLKGIRAFMHRHLPNFNDQAYARRKLLAVEELFNKILGSDSFTFKVFE